MVTLTRISDLTPPSTGVVRNVSSIAALKAELLDDAVDEIVLANGTYIVANAASQLSNSLWIDGAYAARTRPVLVRAEIDGGVTFNGPGTSSTTLGWLTFTDGCHHQTWRGFNFGNGEPTDTGVIVIGGYQGNDPPHHLTLLNFTFLSTIQSSNPSGTSNDHGIYISWALAPGPYDIIIDGFVCNNNAGAGSLDSAIHLFHSDAANPNAQRVTIRNFTIVGTDQAIIIWDASITDLVIEDGTITGVTEYGIRYQQANLGTTLRRITTVDSGLRGFYSSLQPNYPTSGSPPAGLTVEACTFG